MKYYKVVTFGSCDRKALGIPAYRTSFKRAKQDAHEIHGTGSVTAVRIAECDNKRALADADVSATNGPGWRIVNYPR